MHTRARLDRWISDFEQCPIVDLWKGCAAKVKNGSVLLGNGKPYGGELVPRVSPGGGGTDGRTCTRVHVWIAGTPLQSSAQFGACRGGFAAKVKCGGVLHGNGGSHGSQHASSVSLRVGELTAKTCTR